MKRKFNMILEMISTNEFKILPGSLAYSFFLAIIPILSIIFYLLSSLNLPMNEVNNFLINTFPKAVVNFIQPVFNNDIPLNQFITLCLSIFVITNGCNSIIVASNTIFGFENASYIRRLVKSLFLAILLIVLIAFIMIVPLFGKAIINLIGLFTTFIEKHRSSIDTIYTILQIPVSMIVMFFIIKLVYIVAPDDKVKGKYVNRGALFTTISWLIVTVVFSYYINNIARYNLVYGNLANIVILLFWFYILAYIFVIGLYLNRIKTEAGIEKTNKIKLDEIRKRVLEERLKEKEVQEKGEE